MVFCAGWNFHNIIWRPSKIPVTPALHTEETAAHPNQSEGFQSEDGKHYLKFLGTVLWLSTWLSRQSTSRTRKLTGERRTNLTGRTCRIRQGTESQSSSQAHSWGRRGPWSHPKAADKRSSDQDPPKGAREHDHLWMCVAYRLVLQVQVYSSMDKDFMRAWLEHHGKCIWSKGGPRLKSSCTLWETGSTVSKCHQSSIKGHGQMSNEWFSPWRGLLILVCLSHIIDTGKEYQEICKVESIETAQPSVLGKFFFGETSAPVWSGLGVILVCRFTVSLKPALCTPGLSGWPIDLFLWHKRTNWHLGSLSFWGILGTPRSCPKWGGSSGSLATTLRFAVLVLH